MSKVSKRILNKSLESYIFELFIKTIVELKDQTETKNFIEDLLSPSEKIMLIKRLAIAILLTKGYTYDAIDYILKVSRPTIMNVSYFLKYGQRGYQKTVNKIIEDQEKEARIDKIEEIILHLSPPKRFGSIAFEGKQKKGKTLFRRKQKRSML